MKAWHFTTDVFTENFSQKRRILTHFSTLKFNWPKNWYSAVVSISNYDIFNPQWNVA